MGNRAVITIGKVDTEGRLLTTMGSIREKIGIYLHWNGGRDSVEAFLAYCDAKGYPSPDTDCYGWARMCQVIGNFFGGTGSLGLDKCCRLDCDNYDNGVYLIKDWKIVGRLYHEGREQQYYDLLEMMLEINKAQPESERLDEDYIKKYVEELKNGSIKD